MPEGVSINGRVLAELRTLAGMDQVDLANASCVLTPGCRLTETKISAYEREDRRPTTANLNAVLKALEHGWQQRGLEFGEAEQRALVRTPTLDAATSNGSAHQEDPADRRTAGKTLMMGGLGAALWRREAAEIIVHHGERMVDAKLIAAHADLADSLASMYRTQRCDVLAAPVVRHADVVLRLLERPMALLDRRRLEATAVGSCAQAGLLAFQIGDRTTARRYFAVGRDVADDAADDTLAARALGMTSILYSSVPTGGRGGNPRQAVALVREAAKCAQRSDVDTRRWVNRWLAEELAAIRDDRGFHAALAIVESLDGQSSSGDGFFTHYSAGEDQELISETRGIGLVRVGRPDDALEALEALKAAGPRQVTIGFIEIAAVRVFQAEPEEACAALVRAIDLAVDAGYAMAFERIRGVRASFPAEWNTLPCVIGFDEQRRLAIASLQRQQ